MSSLTKTKSSSSTSALLEICASIRIVCLCIVGACIFGILNDQITIRICFEYFSQGFHKNMIQGTWIEEFLRKYPDNCTVWGIVWGILATWWVGAILGVLLSISSRVGSWPRLSSRNLIFPIFVCISLLGSTILFLALFKCRFGEKIPADQIAKELEGYQFYIENYDSALHEKMGRNYLLCSFIHLLDYAIGFLYGLVTVLWSIYKRYRLKCSKTA